MRAALVLGLLVVVAVPARADRATFASIGGSLGVRPGADTGDGVTQTADTFGGARLTLSFEDPFVGYPAVLEKTDVSLRLVPELLAGFLANDIKAEGMIGAGVRAELQMATLGREPFHLKLRAALYLAARAEVIGADRDPAVELVFGEYFPFNHGRSRLGVDVGVVLRKTSDPTANDNPMVLTNLYVGWGL